MDRINYNQSGGFPLNTDRLTDMQESLVPLINGLGAMAGNLVIISGCEENNTLIGNGVVQIEGELFEFKGGAQQEFITLFEEKIEKEFETGEIKTIYYKRTIGFGSGAKNYKWADFIRLPKLVTILELATNKRVDELEKRIKVLEKKTAVFQSEGALVLWNKPANQIPAGWREVTDFRGKFPLGAVPGSNLYALYKSGGSFEAPAITLENLPEIELPTEGVYGNSGKITGFKTDGGYVPTYSTTIWGKSKPLNITNPYRTVLFIEYVG